LVLWQMSREYGIPIRLLSTMITSKELSEYQEVSRLDPPLGIRLDILFSRLAWFLHNMFADKKSNLSLKRVYNIIGKWTDQDEEVNPKHVEAKVRDFLRTMKAMKKNRKGKGK